MIDLLVFKRQVNTERSICTNRRGGKPAQAAKMANEIQCILTYVTQ